MEYKDLRLEELKQRLERATSLLRQAKRYLAKELIQRLEHAMSLLRQAECYLRKDKPHDVQG